MFKKILILSAITLSASIYAGGFTSIVQGLRGTRPTVDTYQALTYIISTDTAPPMSKAASLDLLKSTLRMLWLSNVSMQEHFNFA